jgi:hypothetical protein
LIEVRFPFTSLFTSKNLMSILMACQNMQNIPGMQCPIQIGMHKKRSVIWMIFYD